MKLYTLDNKFIKEAKFVPHDFTGISVHPDGSKYWRKNGNRHRIDGPAVEYYNGTKYWFLNNKIHRIGGPAVDFPNGTKYWFIIDKEVTEQEHDLLYSIMELKGL